MSNLSTKDKLRLRLSAKRLAAWQVLRKKWADQSEAQRNPRDKQGNLKRGKHLAGMQGTDWDKPSITGLRKAVGPEIIRPDKLDWR